MFFFDGKLYSYRCPYGFGKSGLISILSSMSPTKSLFRTSLRRRAHAVVADNWADGIHLTTAAVVAVDVTTDVRVVVVVNR